MVREKTGSGIRFLFQIFIAIAQFLVAIGILQYFVNNNIDIWGTHIVYPLIGSLTYLVLQGVWRIIDNLINWRVTASKPTYLNQLILKILNRLGCFPKRVKNWNTHHHLPVFVWHIFGFHDRDIRICPYIRENQVLCANRGL